MIRRSWSLLAGALLFAPHGPVTPVRDGEVRAVSLVPASGRAELVIQVHGAVEVADRVLSDPARIVLDLTGATLSSGVARYDGIKRAGVLNVRVSQFTPQVVRVVLDVERLLPYRIERGTDAIKVSFGSDQGFLAWNGGAVTAAEPAETPVRPVAAAAPVDAPPPGANVIHTSAQQRGVPRINVTWYDADIQDVISGFQKVSGKSIILGKG